ncbi:DUF1570 domain-containing protein [Stieleria marina]|uniref:DUF1570 domain-containing protein n=1 Tax=Stieleria marina TaxID=1930275 RepID=A0A517NYH2_9BACT|nr:hypothetical protein K239x_41780 [Planctomycetes bacterium K23_9]
MFRIRLFIAFLFVAILPATIQAQISIPMPDIGRSVRESQERAAQMSKEMDERMKELRERTRMPGFPSGFPGGFSGPGLGRSSIGRPGQGVNGPAAGGQTTGAAGIASPIPQSIQSREQLESGGLKLAQGEITYSNGERILVRGDDGEPIVGRLHVTVGDTQMVLMPDGLLKTFPKSETRPTTEKFVPLSMKAIETALLQDPKLKNFKTKRSRRFLYVYNTSEIFVDSTRTILESMYPAVRKYFSRSGIDIHEPELPLVIIAFATDDQFQDYRRMPQGVVAYYDGISNAVMLYERSKLSAHAPEIAVKSAISTIAHEGAHQILHNIGVQQRLSKWPMWLSEGLAEFYAPTSVQKGVRWSGIASTNQLRMMEIEREWTANRVLGTGATANRVADADQLSSLDYAYSWALIHMFSRRHQKELFACIRQCSELRPLDGTDLVSQPIATSADVFAKHFGSDYQAIERELHKHLTSLNYVDPVKSQTHFLVVADGRVTLTSSPEKVKEIQRATRFGRARVQKYANRTLAERAMASITK